MTSTTTTLDIEAMRAFGVKMPKAVEDAEAVLQAVRERYAERAQQTASAKLKTVAPKDVPSVLDEISDAYARNGAFKDAFAAEVHKIAEDRLIRAWIAAKPGALNDLLFSVADKVAEANELAERVSPALAMDLNASTNAEALADAARLRVLMSELKNVANQSTTYVRSAIQDEWGAGSLFTLTRVTDAPLDYQKLWAVQRAMMPTKTQTLSPLTPAGLVALRASSHRLVFHTVEDQISRLRTVWESRQGYEAVDGQVKRLDPADQARKAKLAALSANMSPID